MLQAGSIMRAWSITIILTLLSFTSCNLNNAPVAVEDEAPRPTRPAPPRRPLDANEMRSQVTQLRIEKDQAFRSEADSPIPAAERASFKGLKYFDYDAAFRVSAKLEHYNQPETIKMITSKGEPDNYIRYAKLTFNINNAPYSLDAFKMVGENSARLFLPFKDTTSGKESYGAGRYLELDETNSSEYIIDFNLAYSPYCAYNETYSCPIPPAQNHLKTEVRAGEKSYH